MSLVDWPLSDCGERDVTCRLATFRLWREMSLVDWPLSDCGERDVTCKLATFRLWRERCHL